MSENKKVVSNKYFERSIYLLIFVTSILFLVFGILLAKIWKDDPDFVFQKLIPLTVSELGVAGLIAIILISTIEKFSRKRHEEATEKMHEEFYTVTEEMHKEINNNVFRAVYKRNINEKILQEVERSLFNSKVQREKYTIFYTLEHIDKKLDAKTDEFEHLLVTTRSTYIIQNISNGPVEHAIQSNFELPIDDRWLEMVNFTKLTITGVSPCILEGDELRSYVKPNDDKDQLLLNYNIEIPEGKAIEVIIEGTLVKRVTDMEVWASKIPSDGIELHVYSPPDIKVCASANHSLKLLPKNPDENRTVWVLEYGLFPHQSIVFWWSNKK